MSEQEAKNQATPEPEKKDKEPAPPLPPAEEGGDFKPEPMPVIHDEMAISYDEILDLLKKKSGVVVGKNDPILMMVPFCNAFLHQEVKIVNRHHEALALTMSKKTDTFVNTIKDVVDDLEKTLSSKALASLEGVFKEHLEAMQKYQNKLQSLSLFVGLGIIFQIGILFGLAVGLFSMHK